MEVEITTGFFFFFFFGGVGGESFSFAEHRLCCVLAGLLRSDATWHLYPQQDLGW